MTGGEHASTSKKLSAAKSHSLNSKTIRTPRIAFLNRPSRPDRSAGHIEDVVTLENNNNNHNNTPVSTTTESEACESSRWRPLPVKLPRLPQKTSSSSRSNMTDKNTLGHNHNIGLAQLASSLSHSLRTSDKGIVRSTTSQLSKRNSDEHHTSQVNDANVQDHLEDVVQERELFVLIHGLQGAPEDFSYLAEMLKSTRAHSAGRLVLHAPAVNAENTHDGLANGGERLVVDIRRVIREEEEKGRKLHKLSMLGFSLGGLYARYVAGALYQKDGTLAGLKAGMLVLVASPHLGVRKFGVYRFVPNAVGSAPVLSETIREMMLSDERQLLLRMTEDSVDENDEIMFLSALKLFEERVLYANLRNDFMVNFGTAALDTSVRAISGGEVERIMQARAPHLIDYDHDDKGCKICFRYWLDGKMSKIKELAVKDGEKDDGDGTDSHGEGRIRNLIPTGLAKMVSSSSSSTSSTPSPSDEEEIMAQRLRELGWWVIGVEFPAALPIAHNRIVAMSRNAIHSWMNAPGKRVVHHMVDLIGKRFDGHECMFRSASGDCNALGTPPECTIPGSPAMTEVPGTILPH